MKYLDYNGLLYVIKQIKAWLKGKVDKVEGKGLSTNDFTNDQKTKLEGLENYTLPTASADTKGGFKVGAGLTMNGEVLSATGGGTADSVDWSNVQNKPTKLSDFTNDSDFQTSTQVEQTINSKISSVMTYKGTVANYSDLPTNASTGDTYNITNASAYNKAGDNAVWNGTAWDVLSGTIDLSNYYAKTEIVAITNDEIDTICATE